MRAVVLDGYGGTEVLRVADVDAPIPGPEDLLVDIHHGALNRADVVQRTGGYPDPRRAKGDPSPEIPGMEYAGRVAAVGARVTGWAVGDPVMGIEAGGCYAEQVVTHHRMALPIPAGLDLADAAAVPEVFITAWDALVVQGGLTSGRWALIHAGASGVGTAGIQIAKAVGAKVAVTCSSGKAAACRDLGADLVLERSPADWPAALQAGLETQGCTVGVDTILDVVGGDEADRNLRVVRPKGTIVQVGLMGGGAVTVNLGLLLAKRVRWVGTVLRSRPLEEKAAISRRFADEVLPLFTTGALRPVIDRRFPLAEVAAAHRHMEADANVGKILLDI
ncbi:MAG TPA: NAD(P)H-quinone oxidoreductase [Ilumatobacteraceae bacterium]|nr:NAD(P)H-quinone oxidoreductase [Ilumatobacteraceae bacterium]